MTGWEPNRQDVTLPSGARCVLRRHVSLRWIAAKAAERGDGDTMGGVMALASGVDVDDAATLQLERDLVEAAFIRPRLVWDPELVPADVPVDEDGVPEVVCAIDIPDADITHVLTLVMQGVADAATFPGDADGGDGGGDGPGVGGKAKRPARAGSGKR